MSYDTTVDTGERICTSCGELTFQPDAICAVCTDPPVNNGRFVCCGGMAPEHMIPCAVGDAISGARHALARRQVVRPRYERILGSDLFEGPSCRRCGHGAYRLDEPHSLDVVATCAHCGTEVVR